MYLSYRNSLLFRLVNLRPKKYSRKIIFAQTKLNENNFTSRVWWALIEEIALRVEEMACENEMACCVRGYHVRIRGYMGSSNWGSAGVSSLVCRHRNNFSL